MTGRKMPFTLLRKTRKSHWVIWQFDHFADENEESKTGKSTSKSKHSSHWYHLPKLNRKIEDIPKSIFLVQTGAGGGIKGVGKGTQEHWQREVDTGCGTGDGIFYVKNTAMNNFIIHSALIKSYFGKK